MLKVSVIIPAYRAQSTLPRAVRSLQAQSMPDWEALIVSDDGHDYRAILDAEVRSDPRLRFFSTGGNGSGAAAARNRVLDDTVGDFVAPLDADDVYLPERLSRLVPLAEKSGAAFDNVVVIDDRSGDVLQQLFEVEEDFMLDGPAFLATSVPMMPLTRRELVRPWDQAIELCDDVTFNLQIFDKVGAAPVTAEALHEYRVHPGSLCHAADSEARAERDYNLLLRRLDEDGYGLSDRALVAAAKGAFEVKRALNRDFARAREAGEVRHFQDYLAQIAAGASSSRAGASGQAGQR